MSKDSPKKTLMVALLLCLVCSLFVSAAAVFLKPMQEENKKLDVRKNLLMSAGLLKSSKVSKEEIEEAFKQVRARVIDLSTGEFVTDIDLEKFDAKKAAKDPSQSIRIESNKDISGIKRRAKLAKLYFIINEGSVEKVVLPVYGKGLWSTMYGFLALGTDANTVEGFAFYDHGETPGLGGEIDNPGWKKQWIGKSIFDSSFMPIIKVLKNKVSANDPQKDYKVDGLSGATLTCNGVTNLLHYWLGEHGYNKFLKRFKEAGGQLL